MMLGTPSVRLSERSGGRAEPGVSGASIEQDHCEAALSAPPMAKELARTTRYPILQVEGSTSESDVFDYEMVAMARRSGFRGNMKRVLSGSQARTFSCGKSGVVVFLL